MGKNMSKTTLPLIVLCAVALCMAFYFGVKHNRVATKLERVKASTEDSKSIYTDQSKKTLDSLLNLGNYEEAMVMAERLQTSPHFSSDEDFKLRYQLISDLNRLSSAKNKPIDSANNTTLIDTIVATELTSVEDSLVNALRRSFNEVASLKRQLKERSSSEYLDFKSTKGTQLHYVGSVSSGQANGFGIALLETGSRYEGEWKNNMRHGHGDFYWDDGEHYEGSYVNDKREGFGTYHWGNGEKYVGEWKNDMRHGEGKFYNKRGKLKAGGIWEEDKLVEEFE